jgi:uncharacterized protein YjbI with pentapeptide repeats
MADPGHLEQLKRGVRAWNAWRRRHRGLRPDLSGEPVSDLERQIGMLADAVANEVMPGRAPVEGGGLSGLDLASADLRGCDLSGANLSRANLMLADLRGADLRAANLSGAILTSARLTGCDLREATLNGAILRFASLQGARLDNAMLRLCNLDRANASRAVLRGADLAFTSLNEAVLASADLSGAFVYGCSAWNVDLRRARQQNLRITRTDEGTITVDDLKIAQFIHTILNNENVRNVIDTLTTKLVLILGRFTPERKAVLAEVKRWLHAHDYVPVIFDFERPASRDFTETVVTLAHMARFIIADLTDPASLPKELEAVVPRLAVPVQPILQKGAAVYAMFRDYWKYDWVLGVWSYAGLAGLRAGMRAHVVRPAEKKARELAARRAAAAARLDP